MLPQTITDYLAANRERHLQELFELLRFPSISSKSAHEEDCLACVERVADHLRGLGFEAELRPWHNHPVLMARWPGATRCDKTVLLYGHYDVQPPEPLELWTSPPFEPTIRDGAVYARGANDNKGQFWAHVKALEAFIRTSGEPPLNVIFLAEGEEEIGSPKFEQFMAANVDDLRADYCVVSDSEFFAAGLPTITYGLRGLAYVELTLTGPASDLHSGLHGGAAVNPLNALAGMIARMHDADGRVTLPGFYDDVVELTAAEREAWEKLPFDEAEYAAALGAAPAGGEKGRGLLERRWARPTLDVNGFIGGHQEEGSKTVIPSAATAKISMRLVPDQRPERIVEAFRQFMDANTPLGVRASLQTNAEARPIVVPLDCPAMTAGKAALAEAFGGETALVRNGASVPITELIQRVVGVDPILMGFGLPTDSLHAPNEHFRLEQFYGGITAAAAMLHNLAEAD